MITFFLIRHGDTDALGKTLAGWRPGWHLSSNGRAQADRLAQKLARFPISAIHTSPLERAEETAEPIAALHKLELLRSNEIGEVHMGSWEGLPFEDLEQREDWRRFHAFRSGSRAPGGESMLEVQARMMRHIECL